MMSASRIAVAVAVAGLAWTAAAPSRAASGEVDETFELKPEMLKPAGAPEIKMLDNQIKINHRIEHRHGQFAADPRLFSPELGKACPSNEPAAQAMDKRFVESVVKRGGGKTADGKDVAVILDFLVQPTDPADVNIAAGPKHEPPKLQYLIFVQDKKILARVELVPGSYSATHLNEKINDYQFYDVFCARFRQRKERGAELDPERLKNLGNVLQRS